MAKGILQKHAASWQLEYYSLSARYVTDQSFYAHHSVSLGRAHFCFFRGLFFSPKVKENGDNDLEGEDAQSKEREMGRSRNIRVSAILKYRGEAMEGHREKPAVLQARRKSKSQFIVSTQ